MNYTFTPTSKKLLSYFTLFYPAPVLRQINTVKHQNHMEICVRWSSGGGNNTGKGVAIIKHSDSFAQCDFDERPNYIVSYVQLNSIRIFSNKHL